jgi:DNA-binding transcriptional ArsR family regulator
MSHSLDEPTIVHGADPERIARLADGLADPRRVRALSLLRSNPATVNEIAAALTLWPSETSFQLSKLRDLGLVRVTRRGRYRIYSGDPDVLGRLLDGLGEAAASAPGTSPARRSRVPARPRPGSDLQRARTCYGHLAGSLGVELASKIEAKGWLVRGATGFLVTQQGEKELARRGVDLDSCRESRRKLAPGCLDWTEHRTHIGGALGAAILSALTTSGFIEIRAGRHVRVHRPTDEWLSGRTRRLPTSRQ